jgi:ribonuclease HIII
VTPPKSETRKYTVRDKAVQQRLEQQLIHRTDSVRESEQNCIYRVKITRGSQTVFVRQFTNGTLTVSGLAPLLDEIDGEVKSILGVSSAQATQNSEHKTRLDAQIEAVNAVELGDQWIGSDESGKGDYFGPLVSAAVFVDLQIAKQLEVLGVKDSKSLTDKQNQGIANEIRKLCGKRAQIVTLPPERYNALYDQFRNEGQNLNMLLAWAHSRALENILTEFPQQQITVLVDKFGNEQVVKDKLMERGKKVNLVQLPKAEANVAVAAASILARAQFLQVMEQLSEHYKVQLPKGSSDPRVIEVGKQIAAQYGKDELRKVAKLHFVTTQKIVNSIVS